MAEPAVAAAVALAEGRTVDTDAHPHGPAHFSFSYALDHIKAGVKVTREGWNAAGQYVVLQAGYPDGIDANANTARALGVPLGTTLRFRPYLLLCTADGSFTPWQPTGSDVLAEDWCLAVAE